MFIEGSNGTKDQVEFACNVAISSFMAAGQHKYRPASLKVRGSRAYGVTSREVGADGEAVDIELMLVVCGCRGRNTMGCCQMGGGEDIKALECSCGRE